MYLEEIVEKLSQYITENRFTLFKQKAKNRIANIYIALENIYQPHNASAVLRSADAFGFQNILVIEDANKFRPNKGVSVGAEKWLNITKFASKKDFLDFIKKNNLRLVVVTMDCSNKPAKNIKEYTPRPGDVFLFGAEEKGVSDFIKDNADLCVFIPMYGFVESFNISVSAAIVMFSLRNKIDNSFKEFAYGKTGEFTLMFEWITKSIKGVNSILKKLNIQK